MNKSDDLLNQIKNLQSDLEKEKFCSNLYLEQLRSSHAQNAILQSDHDQLLESNMNLKSQIHALKEQIAIMQEGVQPTIREIMPTPEKSQDEPLQSNHAPPLGIFIQSNPTEYHYSDPESHRSMESLVILTSESDGSDLEEPLDTILVVCENPKARIHTLSFLNTFLETHFGEIKHYARSAHSGMIPLHVAIESDFTSFAVTVCLIFV